MGRVLTNATSLLYSRKDSDEWRRFRYNTIREYGGVTTNEQSRPIGPERTATQGKVTTKSSRVGLETHCVRSRFIDFVEGFCFSNMTVVGGGAVDVWYPTAVTAGVQASKALDLSVAVPVENETVTIGSTVYRWRDTLAQAYDVKIGASIETSVENLVDAINATGTAGVEYFAGTLIHPSVTAVKTDADTVTVTANDAGIAGNSIALAETMTNGAWAGGAVALSGGVDGYFTVADLNVTLVLNTIIFVRGTQRDANNGLFVVSSGSSDTQINVVAPDLETDATLPSNAEIAVCGFQFAVGDLDVNADGNLVSTAKDMTGLGLTPGQYVYVGSGPSGSSTTKFATAANAGLARVDEVSANLMRLSKTRQAFVTEANTTKLVHLYFGPFVRDVPQDDADFLEQEFDFELAWPNLGDAGATKYEYARDQLCNEMTWGLPLTSLATLSLGFMGRRALAPDTTRDTGTDDPTLPNSEEPFSTGTDIARITLAELDETGELTDFKSLNIMIRNNVSEEYVLGGDEDGGASARYMNYGYFDIEFDAEMLFTDSSIISAIYDNTPMSLMWGMRNSEGGLVGDIPALTLEGGNRNLPVNESVKVQCKGKAHRSEDFDHVIGITLFPYLPSGQS